MTPADSSILQIDDGVDNWYRVLNVSLDRTVPAGETVAFETLMQFVSDTDNTVIQIVPGMKPVSQTNNIIFTPLINTLKIDANLPRLINDNAITQTVASANCNGAGYWVRNLTPGANVYIIVGRFIVRQVVA